MQARRRALLAAIGAVLVVGIGTIWVMRGGGAGSELDVDIPQHVLRQLDTHRELASAKELIPAGRAQEALAIFQRIAKECEGASQGHEALLHTAKSLVALKRLDEAIQVCRQVLDGAPEDMDTVRGQARITMGRAHVFAGRDEEGFEHIEALIADKATVLPELCADALLATVDLHWKKGDYGAARSVCNRVIEDFPGGEHVKADTAKDVIDQLRAQLAEQQKEAISLKASEDKGVHVTSIPAGEARWSKDKSPYLIAEEITVPAGSTLSIEPGAEVRFGVRGGLLVQGTLQASGTAEAPIRMVPILGDASKSWWAGIRIVTDEGATPSRLTHTTVEGAEIGVSCARGTVTLETCVLAFCHVTALLAEKEGKLTARDCRITESFHGARCARGGAMHLVGGHISASRGNGVVFQLSSDVSVRKTVVEGSHRFGVLLRDKCDGTVAEATISNNRDDGIHCMGESAPHLVGNVIEGNVGRGNHYRDRSTARVEDNRIRKNQAGGICITVSDEGLVRRNVIEGNAGPGLECGTGSGPRVEGNYIRQNTGGGVLVQPGGAGRFTNNDLSGNEGFSLSNRSSTPIDAKGNYWGSDAPARIAEVVEDRQDDENWGPVDVEPWLPAAPAGPKAGPQ